MDRMRVRDKVDGKTSRKKGSEDAEDGKKEDVEKSGH